ncbi:MAG: hypothetical protein KFF50_01885 [Desulfatitalea sp.]|nr:hypothetical protein [Desulfatitalea sp.]
MISKINEAPLRAVMKADPIGPIHDQEMNRQRADALREARPVEPSSASDATGSKNAEKDPTSKYLMEGEKVVFEKYNKAGDVIYRLPPSDKPIDERV